MATKSGAVRLLSVRAVVSTVNNRSEYRVQSVG